MAAHLTHKPQGVAFDMVFKAYLSSDHVTAATGKTIAVQISKNKAAFGNPSAGVVNMTEIANGWYYVNMSSTDTNTLGPMILRGTSSGVDDVEAFWNMVDAHNAGFDGVFSAAAGAGVTVTTNNDKTGYALTTAGNAAVADKLLGRNLAGGADGTRTVQDALRVLRNKVSIAAGTLTVTQEDDATPAWTGAVVTTAGNPISSIDPA